MANAQEVELAPPIREKIYPFLEKPEMGEEVLPGFGDGSNCHGTALFTLDAEDLLLFGQKPPRGIEHGSEEDCFFLPVDCTRPGYVGRIFMKRRLTDRRYVEEIEKKPYAIVAFFDWKQMLCHTGVYLGNYSCRDMLFHQSNTGEFFGMTEVETYARLNMGKHYSVKYFMPKLRKTQT